MQSKLEIPRIPYDIHLGVTKEEQKQKQRIEVSIEIYFASSPKACASDAIEETINYAEVADRIQSLLDKRKFHLIEFVAREIYLEIKPWLKEKLVIQVHKLKPPHPLLENGATFCYGDKT